MICGGVLGVSCLYWGKYSVFKLRDLTEKKKEKKCLNESLVKNNYFKYLKCVTWKKCEVLEESTFSLRILFELTKIDLLRVTDLARRANLLRPKN